MNYSINIVKLINPLSYKGRGRPCKKDYVEDLGELIRIICSNKFVEK